MSLQKGALVGVFLTAIGIGLAYGANELVEWYNEDDPCAGMAMTNCAVQPDGSMKPLAPERPYERSSYNTDPLSTHVLYWESAPSPVGERQ